MGNRCKLMRTGKKVAFDKVEKIEKRLLSRRKNTLYMQMLYCQVCVSVVW